MGGGGGCEEEAGPWMRDGVRMWRRGGDDGWMRAKQMGDGGGGEGRRMRTGGGTRDE